MSFGSSLVNGTPTYGTGRHIEVLAMPYLLNDKTAPRSPYLQAGVADLNPANITVCRGRYRVIDASGI
ncbi:hypothetical protein [Streptomyces zagrosensis]|uniref:Uncharacterized protein n=1 Tax=Streptomyces zagrosensis TaxID=1042984 RepID=A0A7W9QE09_9ACTN|nr:hypothetical protein [Streptomyces zagrosensis]MBB5938558.1 hypothetical protein [Streptomyces zagrosensis]